MKKGLTLLSLFILTFASLNAQGFNYQTVLRNGSGLILTDESVDVKFDILQGSETGIIVYSEVHTGATSTAFGVLNLIVGDGTATSGTFAAIDWSDGPYFLKVTLGTDVMGAVRFNWMPLANYASKAGSVDKASDLDISGAATGDLLYFNGANWTALAKGAENQVLTVSGGEPTWQNAATGSAEAVKMPMLGEVYNGDVIVAVYPDTSVLVVKDEVIMDDAFNTVLSYSTAVTTLDNIGYRMPTHQEMAAIVTNAFHLTNVWNLDATYWTSSSHPTAAETKFMYIVGTGLYNGGDVSDFGSGAGQVIAVKKVDYQP